MKIALGADSAGKPLLDVVAAHLAGKPGLEVTDLSQPGFYADIAAVTAATITSGENDRGHPVLRHRHRRLHFGQQGARHPRRTHP